LADEADMANDLADRWLDRALATAAAGGPRLAPKGECYYCAEEFNMDDPLESKKLYCDSDCASAHEREKRLKNLR
jgi:hypothetical protein